MHQDQQLIVMLRRLNDADVTRKPSLVPRRRLQTQRAAVSIKFSLLPTVVLGMKNEAILGNSESAARRSSHLKKHNCMV